jgi:uncharacterized membrane protein YbhN (UPF0104 family)
MVVGAALSLTRLEVSSEDLHWAAITVAVLLGLLLIPLNALEYAMSGQVAGTRVAFGEAVGVTVVASAFNVLPVPAGTVVRMRGLHRAGSATTTALVATGFVGLTWLSWGLVVGAVSLFVLGSAGFATLFLGGGIAGLGAGWVMIRHKSAATRRRLLLLTSLLELCFLVLGALRFYLVVVGIGVSVEPAQAVVLAVSSVLASTLGVIPGGLGVWEGVSAALAVLVSLPAAAGFLAAAILRVAGIVQYSLSALVLVAVRSRARRQIRGRAT